MAPKVDKNEKLAKRQLETSQKSTRKRQDDDMVTNKKRAESETLLRMTKAKTTLKTTKAKAENTTPMKRKPTKTDDKRTVKKKMQAETVQHHPFIFTRAFSKSYEEKTQELGCSTEVSQLHMPSSSGMTLKNEAYHRTGIVTRSMSLSSAIPMVEADDNSRQKDVACSTDYKAFVEACTQVESGDHAGIQFDQQLLSGKGAQSKCAYELDPCIVDLKSWKDPSECPEFFESGESDMEYEDLPISQNGLSEVERSYVIDEDIGGDRLETASQVSSGFETSTILDDFETDDNERLQETGDINDLTTPNCRPEPCPQQATEQRRHGPDLGGTFWGLLSWYSRLRK